MYLLRVLHQFIGTIGALIIIIMAVTGILLNHRSLIGFTSIKETELQKIVFSIHSGFVGDVSVVWITDFSAICMLTLSLTGLWMFISFRRLK